MWRRNKLEKLESKIIALLPEIVDNGPNQKSRQLLHSIGLKNNQIEEVLQLVNDAAGRNYLYEKGMKPDQFSGFYETNRIFQEALKIFIANRDTTHNNA